MIYSVTRKYNIHTEQHAWRHRPPDRYHFKSGTQKTETQTKVEDGCKLQLEEMEIMIGGDDSDINIPTFIDDE